MSRPARRVHLLQLGTGTVGGALVRQILARREAVKESHGLDLVYCGLFRSKGGVFLPDGLDAKTVANFQELPQKGEQALKALDQLQPPFIVIDATVSGDTLPILQRALDLGGSVVTANKQPLTSSLADFDRLEPYIGRKLFFETTVGAGLPVISPLQSLIASGDEIIQIQGCFSGTLGYLFSQMETGTPFSEAVAEAKRQGFTEPDPREDLSGADVARKALILARLLGRRLELDDIEVQQLYPSALQKLDVPHFMKAITKLDEDYKDKISQSAVKNDVLRYVATVATDSVKVGLVEAPRLTDIGSLTGPDNILVIKTKRYFDNPLVVKGPGAGPDVTATGLFGDILLAGARHD